MRARRFEYFVTYNSTDDKGTVVGHITVRLPRKMNERMVDETAEFVKNQFNFHAVTVQSYTLIREMRSLKK